MHLAAEIFAAELRLKQAAGAHAGQITRNQRREMKHGKPLQRQQHLGAAFRLDAGEQLQIALQKRRIDHIAGRGQAGPIETPEGIV